MIEAVKQKVCSYMTNVQIEEFNNGCFKLFYNIDNYFIKTKNYDEKIILLFLVHPSTL